MTTVVSVVAERKGVGAYSTPQNIARFLVEWSVRSPSDVILDPCSGDGIFLEQATDRLHFLGLQNSLPMHISGIEINREVANRTSRRLQGLYGASPKIIPNGFFKTLQTLDEESFDVVLGNPPFARYREFLPEQERERAFDFLKNHGFKSSKITNAWVPFVVAGFHLLKPGGRLAMVLPAELLQVTYAAPIRDYLHNEFGFIYVVTFDKLVFPDVEQEVVLLMGTKGEGRGLHLIECKDGSDPDLLRKFRVPQDPVQNSTEKWTQYFLDDEQRKALRITLSDSHVKRLGEIATVDVGVVTGDNDFFVLAAQSAKERGISERRLHSVVTRTSQMKGLIFTKSDWEDAKSNYLLVANGSNRMSKGLKKYVRLGERRGVQKGYKCSIRKPWYSVPSVWVPDAFLFRQIGAFPRIVLNRAYATCTDTVHRVRFTDKKQSKSIVASFHNSLTLACAEIFGRSYGGGVLELMPTEAEKLPIPLLNDSQLLSEMDELARDSPVEAIQLGDERILHETMKLSRKTISVIHDAWLALSERRRARRKIVTPRTLPLLRRLDN